MTKTEQFIYREEREPLERDDSIYLAGMFEAGGSIELNIEKSGGITYVRPRIAIQDNNLEKITRLKDKYGGNVGKIKGETSWKWRPSRQDIPMIVGNIEPFAPSRRSVIEAIILCTDYDIPVDEKRDLIMDIRSKDRYEHLTKDDYLPLLDEPAFLAGVIDARGTILRKETISKRSDNIAEYGYVYSKLAISTINLPLLEAFKSKYGGELLIQEPQNYTHLVNGVERNIIGKRERTQWRSGARVFNSIVGECLPYSLTTYDELVESLNGLSEQRTERIIFESL